MKLRRTYKFAFKSSFLLTLVVAILTTILSYLFLEEINIWFILLTSASFYILSFLIIQFRVELFIYKRVKKIYDEVTLLDVNDLTKKSITSDMETLSKEVKKFAEDKRLEIEMLQIREEYRREFLGNVAHELKTPLFTVQGYILTLIEGAINDKSIRNKYLKRANKGVERLIDVVKDLDMISKLETGDLNPVFEKFNIVELIENVIELLEMKAKKRTISLTFDKTYDVPIFVRADINRIEQVLINLIENSIKYGKMDGRTTLAVSNYNNDRVIIKVSDDGEGIREANLSRVFERFYRVDKSRSRGQGGSGLGLSIVKHIIETHNQQVFVESTYGEGSTFSFTLEKVQ
ncbi:MAG: ATP-binding protein [Flavobacteriaceae bacterium]|nr:ATP-binding protein [Flavobacteriaceae bacterium]